MKHKKTVVIGSVKPGIYYRQARAQIEVTIEIREEDAIRRDVRLRIATVKESLRITGKVGTSRSICSCGHIEGLIRNHLRKAEFDTLYISREHLRHLLDIWKRWNNNDMRAGCVHQNKLLPWICRLLGVGDSYDELMKIPDFQKCSHCGYSYGSACLYEPLPKDVINFLEHFGNLSWNKKEETSEAKT